jgi:hypothetical protein
VHPLGKIDLPICFGTPTNLRREVLTFEVVRFQGTYHAVLGRPCYAKFMAILNYTYLKLKIHGPACVIIVGPMYHHAYECNVECIEYAEALIESEALIVDLENLTEEVPTLRSMPTTSSRWKPRRPSPSTPVALMRRPCGSAPNSRVNIEIFVWSPPDMPGTRGRSLSTPWTSTSALDR